MIHINELEPLLSPIKAIQKLIEQFDDKGIIMGGIAASILRCLDLFKDRLETGLVVGFYSCGNR